MSASVPRNLMQNDVAPACETHFTTWDFCILLVCITEGTIYFAGRGYVGTPFAPGAGLYLKALVFADLVLAGAAFGVLFAGPPVLVGQFLRGRKERLTAGEWLWLAPFVFDLPAVFTAWMFPGAPLLFFCFSLPLHMTLAAGAVLFFFIPPVFPVWSHRAGCVACVASAVMLVIHLALRML